MAHEILEGIRVLDLTMYRFGPVATTTLAMLGAEVIRIEAPSGDPGRASMNMGMVKGGESKGFGGMNLSAYFEANNSCKKAIVLDLTKPKAREILYQLTAKSDVFMQNMRWGVAARLGCDYQTLKKYNSKLIYCSGTSFGTKGPDAEKPGFDTAGVARAGWMWLPPTEDGEPINPLGGSCDQLGGIFAANAILAALLARERFGIGQACETSHLAASMWLVLDPIQSTYYTGKPLAYLQPRSRAVNAASNYYKCKDGEWLMLLSSIPRQWVPVCQALGIPESIYKDDPRFNTRAARTKNAREAVALFDGYMAKKTREEHIKSFEGKDIFWERVQRVYDLANDPQVIANNYMSDYTHPLTGLTYKFQRLPMQFSETPAVRMGRAPLLGEHTEEILVNLLGYKKGDMPKLLDEIGRPQVAPVED